MAIEKSANSTKRAVVVIHGMGNQTPLATLRSMVDSLWLQDDRLTNANVTRESWTKPERLSDDFELRRITTSRDKKDIRTDFYEFYWAHMMEDARFAAVLWWLKRVFWRAPGRVPEQVVLPWIVGGLVMIALFGVLCGSLLALFKALALVHTSYWCSALWFGGTLVIWAGLWYLRNRVLAQVVGDAARYLTPDPQNINARSRIRSAGLKLLETLHDDPEYDRIIVVAHSLGTVVGYDLLSFFWSDHNKEFDNASPAARTALDDIEAAAAALRQGANGPSQDQISDYQAEQHKYSKSLGVTGKKTWKITDFVTLGSPLTHSSFLVVDDSAALNLSDQERGKSSWVKTWYDRVLLPRQQKVAEVFTSRVAERSFPICPPEPEKPDWKIFSYFADQSHRLKIPNHASVFAAVRWTNIFAPHRMVLFGDVVSGPLSPLFGPGVRDVKLTGAMAKSFIAHVKYWDVNSFKGDDQHIRALRLGVNLLDEDLKSEWNSFL